jgi:beta-aspartyl-dipeptidase (metallo-type)
VLPAFTSNVAALLRFHDRGRIAAGLQADLVVLGEDHRIDEVMVAGIWHVQSGKQQVFGQFERQEQR